MLISFLVAFGLISAVLGAADPTAPISAAAYREVIKQGFATNWFKTPEPLLKYRAKNIEDIYRKGFRNVRLRSRADLYSPPYDSINFAWFLGNLTVVVDKCLETGVAPIISWIHHHAEAYASEGDRRNYVTWWTAVARHLKDRHYALSFNLFTELGLDECEGTKPSCSESLRVRTDKYNRWTSNVVAAIRGTGGKNDRRILILGSPGKTAKDLHKIDENIYKGDDFMLAEWHVYASGPNKKDGGQKYWSGNGMRKGRANVEKAVKEATDFSRGSGLLTYLGAWMPTDNKAGSLKQNEVINFARFFAGKLKEKQIPWSLNVLDRYYDTLTSQWIKEKQDVAGRMLSMYKVLDNIIEEM